MRLFLTFFLFSVTFSGFAQQTETPTTKKVITGCWFGVGPQYSFGEKMTMLGPSMSLNFTLKKTVSFKANAYAVTSLRRTGRSWEKIPAKTMQYVANVSLLPGFKFYDRKHFFFAVFWRS